MAQTISDIDACTKRLEVAIPRADVLDEMNRAYRRLSGRVRIRGFRKGKVPRKVLEQYYGEEVKAEVLNHLIGSSYRRLLEEKGMRPIGEPNVTDIQMEDDAPELTYKATVEVIPPFELGAYTGVEVKVHKHPVSDEAVEEQVQALRMRAATYEDVERPARAGDYVLFDIEAFDGEEPVAGSRGENQAMMLGEDQNEKELDEALVGVKAGETKETDIAVPETAAPDLAGKTLRFKIDVKAVKEPHPPELDEEFVRSLGQGFTTVDDLRAHIRREMEAMEDAHVRSQGMAEMMRKLVEAHPFEVPPSLVRAELEQQIREIERRMKAENPETEISEAQRQQLRQDLGPQAEERVKEMILIERIREKEGIMAESAEVDAQIRQSAQRYRMDPAKLKDRMAMTGALGSLVSNINYNKTAAWLYERAKVEVDVHDHHAHHGESGGEEHHAHPHGGDKEEG